MKRLLPIVAVLTATALPARAADDPVTTELAPRTVAVMPFAGETGGLNGGRIAVKMAEALRDTRRFTVIAPGRIARAARDVDAHRDPQTGDVEASKAAALAAAVKADGVITGQVVKGEGGTALKLTLLSVRGLVISHAEVPLPSVKREAFQEAARTFQKQLDFAGVIVRVDGYHALVNVGSALGVNNETRLYAYDVDSLKVGHDGYEIGAKRGTAELEVIRVGEHAAWVRAIRGGLPPVGSMISMEEIEFQPLPQPKAAAQSKPSFLRLTVGSGLDLLTRVYVLDSDQFRYDSESNVIMAPAVSATWIPWSWHRFDVVTLAEYRHGFVPTHRSEGGVDEEFSASLDQMRVEAGIAHALARQGWFADGEARLSTGYRFHAFKIEDQNPRVLTSDTYHQLLVGAHVEVPVARWLGRNQTQRILAEIEAYYAPVAILSEKPVDNGDASTTALFGSVGAQYNITHRIHASAAVWFEHISNDFDVAGGSRGLTRPQSRDVYRGLLLRVDYRLGRR